MEINKTLSAVAIALSFSIGSVAQADSIATSKLNISNFLWTVDGNGALNNLTASDPHVVISSAGFNFGNLFVNLNGDTDDASTNIPILGEGGQIPSNAVCVGCGDPLAFAPTLAPTPNGTHVFGSHQLTGAIINIDANNNGELDIAGGADAFATAQSSLDTNSSLANASSNLGTNTAFDFVFTGDDVDTTLNLDYDILALAAVVDPFGDTDAATAGVSWNFQLNDLTDGVSVFNWTPGELNHTSGVGAGDPDDIFAGVGSLSQTATLIGGHEYRVNISHQLLTSATRDVGDTPPPVGVPEPGIVALFGIGLLGLLGTASARSRNKS